MMEKLNPLINEKINLLLDQANEKYRQAKELAIELKVPFVLGFDHMQDHIYCNPFFQGTETDFKWFKEHWKIDYLFEVDLVKFKALAELTQEILDILNEAAWIADTNNNNFEFLSLHLKYRGFLRDWDSSDPGCSDNRGEWYE